MRPFTRRDRLWLLALPLYLSLLILRHEGSHAVSAAVLDGAEITEISLLPKFTRDAGLVRPHVRVAGGATSWPTRAAPYFGDAFTFMFLLPICAHGLERSMPKWLWINLAVIGVASPLDARSLPSGVGSWRCPSAGPRLLLPIA